ncbi:MAG: hypothetical protein GEU87_13650 [Alphaproteobacteria bacterium]|nr:hypothetical protein [Alphaproteobacteria bacterium]
MARPRSDNPSPAALRGRRYRRRKKLSRRLLTAWVPQDTVYALELKGIDPADPEKLGELLDDAVLG